MTLHVVVGAGATGIATARLLADDGDRVRLVTRRGTGPVHPGVELVAADGADAARMAELAEGAATILNCAAPPYHRWREEFPPLGAALLAAAERVGADHVVLSNAYAYGPVDGTVTEASPLAPSAVKGEIRARMWRDALAAHDAGRVRVAELRAADFVGPDAYSIYQLMVLPPVLAGQPAGFPGDVDAAHSWTFTTDAARALVALVRSDRAWGRAWHAPTLATVPARDMTERIAEAAGAPAPTLTGLSAEDIRSAGEADPVAAEVSEMLYLFDRPFLFDSSRTEAELGLAPTPLAEAVNDVVAAATAPSAA